jgi:hypothetical protein
VPHDSTPAATTSLTCLRCAYDLTSLDPCSPCPECAYPIADSIRYRGLLRDLDGRWLKSVLHGVRLLTWCSALLAIGGITFAALMLSTILLEQFTNIMTHIPSWPGDVLLILAAVSLVAMHSAGCIYAGSPGPLGLSDPPPGRWGVRFAGAAFMPLSAWMFVSSNVVATPLWAQLIQAAIYEATMLFYLFDLTRLFRWLEQRTPAWSPLRTQRYRETFSNLRWIAVLIVLGGWAYPWLTGGFRSPGVGTMFLGFLTLAIFYPLFARMKRLLVAELLNAPDTAPSAAIA